MEQAALAVHFQEKGSRRERGIGLGRIAGGMGRQLFKVRIVALRQAGDVPVDRSMEIELSLVSDSR